MWLAVTRGTMGFWPSTNQRARSSLSPWARFLMPGKVAKTPGALGRGLLEFAAMQDMRGARAIGALGNNAHTHHGRFGGAIGEFF